MRRAAVILLAAIGVIAATLAMLGAYAVSPAGRGAVASVLERRIARVTGGEVEIGALTGNLTRRVELEGVRFIENGAAWARINRVTLTWSPGALLSRRVEISEILIDGAELLAAPPARARKEPFKGIEFPERLPAVSIGRIALRNLLVSDRLVAEPLRLDGEGAVAMGGPAISIRATIKEARGRDDVEIDIRRETIDVAPALKVKIESKPDGAVAALLKSGGGVVLSVQGSGSPTRYGVAIEAAAGDYGALSGRLTADVAALQTVNFEMTASPGARFDRWRVDIGDKVAASGTLFPDERGARLALQKLSAAFGEATGEAEWRNGDRALDAATVSLQTRFAPAWRPEMQAALGGGGEARIALERKGREYAGTASAVTPIATVTVDALKTDLRSTVSGPFSASLQKASAVAAIIDAPLSGSGNFAMKAGDSISLINATIASGDGASFKGGGSYSFAGKEFSVEGAVAASAVAIKALAPGVTPRGGASGDVEARGSISDFSVKLALAAPGFEIDKSAWPASSISIALARTPASISGEVSMRANDGSVRSFARLRREASGGLALTGIDHRGAGFALTGEAAFNLAKREGAADLRYTGADGAEPWPGLALSGEASVKGAIVQGRTDNRIDIKASALRTKSLSLENAVIAASGSAGRLAFEAAASAVAVQNRARLENLKLTGAAEIAARTEITVNTASAEFQSAPARLDRPATIALGGGVAVDDLSLRIGDKGALDLSGAIERGRWRGVAAIRNLEIWANGATLDFNLALDTTKATAASGDFAAASGRLGGREAALKGRYSWDGRTLAVNAGGGDSALDLDLDVPLALRRGERLSLSMDGALSGAARFEGRAETIALFLPLALQSIEGDLAFSGQLGGTVKDPRVSGELALTGGAYTEAISGLSVVDIDLTSSAAASTASSSVTFTGAASGAGQTAKTIRVDGKVDLGGGVFFVANITLDGARFSAGPVQSVDASGALRIEGPADDLLVSGDVTLAALEAKLFTPEPAGLVDIDVVAVGADGKPAAQEAEVRRRGALRYAVRISADDKVIVSGRGLDSEWRANAQLSGTSARPLVLGVMNLNRGDLEFSGRRFDLTRGSIGFDTLAPNDPTIDLRAERETRDGTAVAVVITGRSSALKVSLESTPSRPSEDVMALILFDKPADELSAFESLQVADALTQLGGVGVFGGKGVTGAARDALGLDLLNLDVDQTDSSASLLTVGKYVTDGLFVSASQNARGENGSLRIEYEIGQSFSLETELRQDGDQTVSANWKKDF